MEIKTIDKRNNSEIAEEILDIIDDYCNTHNSENVVSIVFNYGQRGYGERPFGSGCEERIRRGTAKVTYTIKVCSKEYELERLYSIESIMSYINNILKNENDFCVEYNEHSDGNWNRYKVVDRIDKINYISKDFVKVQEFLKKYANYSLTPTKCYSCDTSGKRGMYYESNYRKYYCTNDARCQVFLQNIQAAINPNVSINVKDVDDYNEEDKQYSEYYETECSGYNTHTISVTFKDKTNVNVVVF